MFREQALRHMSLEYCATEIIKLQTFPRQRPGNELFQNAEMLSTQLQVQYNRHQQFTYLQPDSSHSPCLLARDAAALSQ